MFASRLGLTGFSGVFVALLLSGSCASKDYTRLYQDQPKAPSLDDKQIEALAHLGAKLVDRGANFGVYSEHATRVELLLFDDPESPNATRQFQMTRFGDVWNVYVEGVGLGQHYGFIAFGPNWPFDPRWRPGQIDGFISAVDAQGNRFNPNKLLLDPYCKALNRDHDWSKASVASGPARTESTYAAATKCVIAESTYAWSPDETTWRAGRQMEAFGGHRWNDVILYEVHPKGFTASPASGVKHPGTFRGFGELADYLADLGITAVEMLPVHEKPLDGGYWGYNTLNFFAPEISFSSDKMPGHVLDEFKWMVDQLHQRGIEVVIDVVYNHTGEGGFWRDKIEQDDSGIGDTTSLVNFDAKEVTSIYSFRGLDNAAYYAINPADGSYWNNTGVGNETRTNHKPMRRLILDSLHFYVEELHVDGFRFDLAPILGEKDLDFNNWDDVKNTVLQDIVDDPVLQKYNTRLIAEPWSAGGNYGVKIGAFPASSSKPGTAWGEWNGRFRDWWRAFVNNDTWNLSSQEGEKGTGGFLMTGSFDWYQPSGRRPYHSTNYVTCHDGFTMYDVFSYDQKRNKCGPLNPVCCDQPTSPFCDRDSGENNNRSRSWGTAPADEAFKRQLMRNVFAAMLFSHGTPMLYGGDEWMRTQLGNNNAYSARADNDKNWYQWGEWKAQDERWRMQDFVKAMIKVRKDHAYAFAPAEYGAAAFKWESESGQDPDWNSKHIAIHYNDRIKGPELYVLINMEGGDVKFTFGPGNWVRLVDTQQYFDVPTGAGNWFDMTMADPRKTGNVGEVALMAAEYVVKSRSIVIVEGR